MESFVLKSCIFYVKILLFDFVLKTTESIKSSYEDCGHKLKRVSCGLPIAHDTCSLEAIDWTTLVIEMGDVKSDEDLGRQVEKFSKLLRKNQEKV